MLLVPLQPYRCRRARSQKPRAGCGWRPKKVEALLHNDAEVLALWRRAITGKHGGDRRSEEAMIKVGNSNLDSSRKEPKNSRPYQLARLKRVAPHLFERVVDGRALSANAVAIEADTTLLR